MLLNARRDLRSFATLVVGDLAVLVEIKRILAGELEPLMILFCVRDCVRSC